MAFDKSNTVFDLCACLHTALRKICDSHATTLAYKLIHLLSSDENGAWFLFGNELHKALLAEEIELPDVKDMAVFEEQCRSFIESCISGSHFPREELRADGKSYSRKESEFDVLVLAFRMFNANDWESALTYLAE